METTTTARRHRGDVAPCLHDIGDTRQVTSWSRRLLALGALCTLCTSTVVSAGCASTPQVGTHSMTAPEHERAAATHAVEARSHQAAFDPDAATLFPCMLLGMRGITGTGKCWHEMENPTAVHLAAAERHRELAEEHLEASAFLRERAHQACAAVPIQDRTPAHLVAAVDGSAAILQPDAPRGRASGVTVAVRGVPGVTHLRLQASLDCDLARRAAFGSPRGPQATGAPRAPITATVTPTSRGFDIHFRSEDPATNVRLVENARVSFSHVDVP